jgi:hypothetical protein
LNLFSNPGHKAKYFITLLRDDPFFDNIRNEPEFQSIYQKMEEASVIEQQNIREWLEVNEML